MRIWDIPPKNLCRKYLIAKHGELHSMWSIIINGKKGFSRHPETMRWRGKPKVLYTRHEKLVAEMERRRFNHNSPIDKKTANGDGIQNIYIDKANKQKEILKSKPCEYYE